jgi:hypothetical protein
MSTSKKEATIKFHGTQVKNVIITQMRRTSESSVIEKLDILAAQHTRDRYVETINIQVVADYVTVTYYKDEKANAIIERELIPTHSIENILVKDV